MRRTWGAALLGLLSACGAPPATLTQVQTEVFGVSCVFSACHRGGTPMGSLNLEGGVWSKVVNVTAFGTQGELLVLPGKPESSFLFKKLSGTAPTGRMPPDQPLDAQRLEMVRSWIADGAKNN
jgi:hypothetical protein